VKNVKNNVFEHSHMKMCSTVVDPQKNKGVMGPIHLEIKLIEFAVNSLTQ